ncbi:hypothetical protein [Lactiplantibacillus carotarum]|uniref:hypothetical protein n=1 Tax=Lactiplantibacillus carotarum TaxID=2993456 RepID=UPI00298F111E|nr:hypothetical protein [Lactiplantibacillus carotarum]
MIVKLVDEHKISLSEQISKIIPGLDTNKEITVKDVLLSNGNFIVKKKYINRVAQPDSKMFKLSYIKNSNQSKGYVSADEIIKSILVCKVLNSTYSNAVEDLLVNKLGLSNTRIYQYGRGYANDVKSFKYKKTRVFYCSRNK